MPFCSAVSTAAVPIGSGIEPGFIKLTIGALSWPGVTFSSIARDPDWIAAISVGCNGIGESCQFQKRVISSFSAELERPSTASAKVPPVPSGTMSISGLT
jgi:hypothetical protein